MKLINPLSIFSIPIFFFIFTAFIYTENKYPERVISLSPSITEIIYAIDAWDKVIGVTMYSDYPPEAKDIQHVGGWVNPNLEMIVKLEPDLIILLSDQDKIFGEKLRSLGLNTLVVDSNSSVSHIKDSIIMIGEVLGKSKKSKKLKEEIESVVNDLKRKTSNISPKKVLCVIGRNPGTLDDIYVVGNTSFINELITISGGVNVIKKQRTALKISKEAILSLDPDIIIEINHEKIDKEDEVKQIWSALGEARAIKNNQVKVISSSAILHPSQRIIDGLKQLIIIIHPEVLS